MFVTGTSHRTVGHVEAPDVAGSERCRSVGPYVWDFIHVGVAVARAAGRGFLGFLMFFSMFLQEDSGEEV